jgi:flagellar FliJ protein
MAGFRLQPLVDFAEERSKSAAQALQRMRGQWMQAEEKLRQLEGYLADYRARLSNAASGGMNVGSMLDFQRFIAKLELAIRAQSEEVVRCRDHWEVAEQQWQEREREVKAYHKLRERHELEVQQKENRREQKQQDEIAQNSAWKRTSEDNSRSK